MNLDRSILNDENKLLLSLCRKNDENRIRDNIKSINFENINWNNLYKKSDYHRVIPFVYNNLLEHLNDVVPQSILEKFKLTYIEICKKSLFLSSVLIDILSMLDDNGIKAVSLKGPSLSYLLHNDITLRDFSDLDILIRKTDLHKTCELLESSEYVSQFQLSQHLKEYYENSHYYYVNYTRKDKKVVIDIHWATAVPNYSFSEEFAFLQNRLRNFNFLDNQILMISDEDILLHLGIHGCKHLWRQLNWICDIADICQGNKDLDFKYIMRRANELKCIKIFYNALYMADHFFSCLDPILFKNIVSEVSGDDVDKSFYYGVVFPDQFEKPSSLRKCVYFPMLMDRNKDKLLFFYNNYICPTPLEFSIVRLDRKLFGFYYLIRFARMFYWLFMLILPSFKSSK